MSLVSLLSVSEVMKWLAFMLFGAGVGYLHFSLLWWQTRLLVNGLSLWRAMLLQLVRLAITAAALFICARNGALPLLAALLGLLVARQVLVKKREAA